MKLLSLGIIYTSEHKELASWMKWYIGKRKLVSFTVSIS